MICFENVTKSYVKGTRAIRNVNLTIEDGEFVFLVGDSGSGKSTFLKLLLKEIEITEGKIIVDEMSLERLKRRHLPKYRRKIGMVFQDFRLLNDRSIYENVALAQRVTGVSQREIKQNVTQMLSVVGLSAKIHNSPQELSGGEQQRVAVARAVVNRPKILLADEPTGNLDPQNSIAIMKMLEEINKSMGTTVIVVTHNQSIVQKMNKRVITMNNGVVTHDSSLDGSRNESE